MTSIDFTNLSSKKGPRLDETLLRSRYQQDIILISFAPKEPIPLARFTAGVSILLNEQLGIVPKFRKLRLTKAIIDLWIQNTDLLSEKEIEEDLEVLKNFLLNCEDIFTCNEDKDAIIPIMKLLLKERFLWLDDNDIVKLKTIVYNL